MLPNLDNAYKHLQSALTEYDKKHKDTAGPEGIERRDAFVELLSALEKDKNTANLGKIGAFYLREKSTSRLIIEIKKSWKIIFKIEESKAEPEKYLYSGKTGRYLNQHHQFNLDRQIKNAIHALLNPKPIELQVRPRL